MKKRNQRPYIPVSPTAREMYDYLSDFREEMPDWLKKYKPGDSLIFQDIMACRTSYYPGFWRDGSMLLTANRSHAVHSHIHLDYMNEYEEDLAQVNMITGYHSIGHIVWDLRDILPAGRYPLNVEFNTWTTPDTFCNRHPHFFTEILERDDDKDDSHGAERMAITIFCEDGIDFYYQLYVCQYKTKPWLFMLQDHGLGGGNYDIFGKGGLPDEIMKVNRCRPEFVICENTRETEIWSGYKKIDDVLPIIGGMHQNVRYLYRRRGPKMKLEGNDIENPSFYESRDSEIH